jgi:IgGFc binding protein
VVRPIALAVCCACAALAGCHAGDPNNGLCGRIGPSGCLTDGREGTFTCSNAAGYHETLCTGDQKCAQDECRAPSCTPGLFYCDPQGVAHVCDATGTIDQTTDCAAASGRCIVGPTSASCVAEVCVPSTTFCSADGTTVEKCAPDGMSSDTVQACSDPKQRGVTCAGAVCRDRCTLLEASDRSTLGCRFVGAALFDGAPTLVVGNPQPDLPATITVGGASQTVAPSSLITIPLAGGAGTDLVATSNAPGAIIVTATVPVYAWLYETGGDGLMLHPEHALSTAYLAGIGGGPNALAVVATVNGTQVTVTPAAATDAGGSVPAGVAGTPLSQSLDRGDVLTLFATSDLDGTRVQATAPVAVEIGAPLGEAAMPGADTLGEELALDGTTIVIARDAAMVTTANGVVSLAAGQSTFLDGGQIVRSTAPLLALTHITGNEVLAPVEQWRTAGFAPSPSVDVIALQVETITAGSTTFTLNAQGGLAENGAAVPTPAPLLGPMPFFGHGMGSGVLLVPTGYGLASIHP